LENVPFPIRTLFSYWFGKYGQDEDPVDSVGFDFTAGIESLEASTGFVLSVVSSFIRFVGVWRYVKSKEKDQRKQMFVRPRIDPLIDSENQGVNFLR
jgi:hypothetical protein